MLNVYAVGDVNGDHKTDTAFVDYDIPMGADSSPDYYSGALSKTIKFRNNLPQIEIEQSLGLLVKGTQVTNLNKGTDILVFNRCFLGIWKDMSVYTLFQKKWLEIGHTRIAGEDDQDFDNRIINLKNQYYLLGDKWDDTIGVIKRADTVNIMLL